MTILYITCVKVMQDIKTQISCIVFAFKNEYTISMYAHIISLQFIKQITTFNYQDRFC